MSARGYLGIIMFILVRHAHCLQADLEEIPVK